MLLPLLLLTAITVDPIDADSYRLTVTVPAGTRIDAAHAKLLPTARTSCAGRSPIFGRYKLTPATAPAKPGLLVEQELICGTPRLTVAPDPQQQPSAADQQAVLAASYAYFAAKDSGRYADAHNLLSAAMQQRAPLPEWRAKEQALAATAGVPRGRRVTEISWYTNPPDAPEPGIYVAADFDADFADLDFMCGYLMWRLEPDGSFRLTREEQNFVDKAAAPASIDRDSMRAQMGCKD